MILWDTIPVFQYTGTVIFILTMENLKSHNTVPHQNMRKQQIYKAINRHKKTKILEKTNVNKNTISKFPKWLMEYKIWGSHSSVTMIWVFWDVILCFWQQVHNIFQARQSFIAAGTTTHPASHPQKNWNIFFYSMAKSRCKQSVANYKYRITVQTGVALPAPLLSTKPHQILLTIALS